MGAITGSCPSRVASSWPVERRLRTARWPAGSPSIHLTTLATPANAVHHFISPTCVFMSASLRALHPCSAAPNPHTPLTSSPPINPHPLPRRSGSSTWPPPPYLLLMLTHALFLPQSHLTHNPPPQTPPAGAPAAQPGVFPALHPRPAVLNPHSPSTPATRRCSCSSTWRISCPPSPPCCS